jgi:BTB/POZ domain
MEDEDGYELFDTAHMSVTERLIACLRNDTMTDVALVGDDGVAVPAARYILGSASAAFQPLLYGNSNRDGNASTVNIGESNQKSLTALVEFCCSDELNTSIWADSHPVEIVQDTVALAKLAHTYGLPRLQTKIKNFLNPLMLAYPPLACHVYNLADRVATPDVFDASLVIIQEKAHVAFKSSTSTSHSRGSSNKDLTQTMGGMICFSPAKMEEIMSDNEIEADELFLFQQLVAWRDHNDFRYPNINSICRSLVQHLDLSSIDPNAIETTVMQSGFVTADMLVKALMAQAKSATHEGLAFASLRGPRGRKLAHVLVQGAGDPECNGVYVHVKRGDKASPPTGLNLLYFIKKPTPNITTNGHHVSGKTFILVQDNTGTWRICDSDKKILYEGRNSSNGGKHGEIPQTGWIQVSGELPAPECRWLRPHSNPNSPHRSDTHSTEALPPVGTATRTRAAPNSNNGIDQKISNSSSMMFHKDSQQSGTMGFPCITDEENLEAASFRSAWSTQIPRNEKVKQVMDYDKSSSLPVPPPVAGKIVAEQEKEAAEESHKSRKKEQTSMLTTVDGPLDRKIALEVTPQEKRKISRKSSLIDDVDLADDLATTEVVDPILGTTIGGDGYRPTNQKEPSEMLFVSQQGSHTKLSSDQLKMFDYTSAGSKLKPATSISKPPPFQGVAKSSNPVGCILPSSNGEQVLVGCMSAL